MPGRRGIRKYILLLSALVAIFLWLGSNSILQARMLPEFFPLDLAPQKKILEKINLLILHVVDKGKRRTLHYAKGDLRPGEPLEVKGYVSGVVVLCNDEIEVSLDGRPMSRIRASHDGTLTCKYFGPLRDELIYPYIASGTPKIRSKNARTKPGTVQNVFGGYSYFPRIMGSGVSRQDHFFISLKKGRDLVRIPVRQQGYRTIFTSQPDTGESLSFQYQGTLLKAHFPDEAVLRQRLRAIVAGIREVENRFSLDLVHRVNLVDYEDLHNAVICEGQREIWVYIKVLREETLDELKTLAEHETLHLLVDCQGFAENNELRQHFADLKGFDTFSFERFLVMTKGMGPEQTGNKDRQEADLFAFINEGNFLKGRKGGHSHENPQEFCTSFLHSLMFIERLGDNLDQPLIVKGLGQLYVMTQDKKQQILNDYLKTLEILRDSPARGRGTSKYTDPTRRFLEQAYLRAKHIRPCRQDLAGTGDRSGRDPRGY